MFRIKGLRLPNMSLFILSFYCVHNDFLKKKQISIINFSFTIPVSLKNVIQQDDFSHDEAIH